MISILVTTLHRQKKLEQLIQSIYSGTYQDFEILIADQNNPALQIPQGINDKVRLIHVPRRGKSISLNRLLAHASGDIVAFTDDDCICDKKWLESIDRSFTQHQTVSAIFGKVMPYTPCKTKNTACPSIFLSSKKRYITHPTYHAKAIGFGNNMSIRKSIIKEIGGFKQWVGPGSVSFAAEDAEIALRLLVNTHTILYEPTVIVYHNKWLSPREMDRQQLLYTCGEMACYGYFYFQRKSFASSVFWSNIFESHNHLRLMLKKLITFKFQHLASYKFKLNALRSVYRCRGLLIGLLYSIFDPL